MSLLFFFYPLLFSPFWNKGEITDGRYPFRRFRSATLKKSIPIGIFLYSRQGMTPRPQHPGAQGRPGPRSALTGCGRSAEPDSCFLEVAGVGAEGSAPYPASLTVDETQRSGAARVQSAGALTGGRSLSPASSLAAAPLIARHSPSQGNVE